MPRSSIVFDHGLRGDREGSSLHQESGTRGIVKFILQNLRNFRVLVFGYDANVMHVWNRTSKSGDTNHVQDLLGALARERMLSNWWDKQ